MPKATGRGLSAEPTLPRGPSRAERELLESYDLMEAKVRRLPAGLEWQRITVERTDSGLVVRLEI